MCGIAGGYRPGIDKALKAIAHRGPDANGVVTLGSLSLGHVRLSILDLDSRSNQPFVRGRVTVCYNGELWNYRALRIELEAEGEVFITTGDTEVFAAALDKWGIDALAKMEGMFAVAWSIDGTQVTLARDRFGEVPLHYSAQSNPAFCSEIKGLLEMGVLKQAIRMVPPGCIVRLTKNNFKIESYYNIPLERSSDSLDIATEEIHDRLLSGVAERAIADVPVCTLLSGGIDSAAVALGLSRTIPGVVAFTAKLNPKARDLRCARETAEMLGIDLIEVPVVPPTAEDLTKIISIIEMPHKAQVEIAWACLALAQAMKAEGFKVTFSGEGSDELWASYGFSYHALLTQDWHIYRRDLFVSQHRKNFARCNKIFMDQSVECRLPFLHTPIVEYALSLTKEAVQASRSKPKAVLQGGFQGELPDEVTKRPKVAFQDGMGLKTAIAEVLPNPKRFYTSEMKRLYGNPKD